MSLTSSASPLGINGQTVEMDDGKSGYVGSRVDLLCRFINSSPPVKISQVLIAHLNECTMPSVYGPKRTKSQKHSISGPGGTSFVTLPSRMADGCLYCRFLPVKSYFFLPAVTKCLLSVDRLVVSVFLLLLEGVYLPNRAPLNDY